jgi:hypothetical protein
LERRVDDPSEEGSDVEDSASCLIKWINQPPQPEEQSNLRQHSSASPPSLTSLTRISGFNSELMKKITSIFQLTHKGLMIATLEVQMMEENYGLERCVSDAA